MGEAGIRQFVDIGSGLPASGNVHEVAEQLNPNVRVVYVDKDPIVLAFGRALLSANDNTTVITADLREPDAIFEQPEVNRLIDTSEPFAVLLGGVMMRTARGPRWGHGPSPRPASLGGYLMHCGASDPGDDPRAPELNRIFEQFHMGSRTFPTYAEQLRYFDGLDLVEPGFVPTNKWRAGLDFPDPDNPAHPMVAGGIGRKP